MVWCGVLRTGFGEPLCAKKSRATFWPQSAPGLGLSLVWETGGEFLLIKLAFFFLLINFFFSMNSILRQPGYFKPTIFFIVHIPYVCIYYIHTHTMLLSYFDSWIVYSSSTFVHDADYFKKHYISAFSGCFYPKWITYQGMLYIIIISWSFSL